MPASGKAGVASATPEKGVRFAAMGSRNFRVLWFGLLISNIGTWMATTAESWLVTELEPERAAFMLGLIAISFGLPMVLLPPVGGALADRVPRIRLLWVAAFVYFGLSLALSIVTLTGLVNVWMLMAYAFLNGVVLAFDNPTRQALLPDLVSPAQLTSAISLNSAVFTGAGLIGPALAGALIPPIGVGGVFVIRTISSVAVMWALLQLRDVPQRTGREPAKGSILRTIGSGLAFVRNTPVVGALLLVSLISGLFGRSFVALLAVFARDVHQVGALAFGVMVAAPGLGTLVGAIGLAARRDVPRRGRLIVVTTLAFSTVLLAFAVTGWYVLAVPLLVLSGIFSVIGAALIATLLNLRTPPEIRGRVMSFYTLTLIGVPASGGLLLGTVADLTGVRLAVGGGAVLVGLLTLLAYARNKELREAD